MAVTRPEQHGGSLIHPDRLNLITAFPPPHVPENVSLQPVDSSYPTIFILTSGEEASRAQSLRCYTLFEGLGFSPVLLNGIPSGQALPTSASRAQWAWLVSFLPQINELCRDLPSQAGIVVAEDSAWPTTACTPTEVARIYRSALAKSFCGTWLGAQTKGGWIRRLYHRIDRCSGRVVEVLEGCLTANAPAGCKLFVASCTFWETLQTVHVQLPLDYTMDRVMHLMVAERYLEVCDPHFLAGSMPHYSARQQKDVDQHNRSLPLQAELFSMPAAAQAGLDGIRALSEGGDGTMVPVATPATIFALELHAGEYLGVLVSPVQGVLQVIGAPTPDGFLHRWNVETQRTFPPNVVHDMDEIISVNGIGQGDYVDNTPAMLRELQKRSSIRIIAVRAGPRPSEL